MTDAQLEVESKRVSDNVVYELRKFRKECVTQGIVKFVRDHHFYEMKYRGFFICYIYGYDKSKLRAAWNVIRVAEQLLKAEQFAKGIEGVKHESN